MQVGLDIVSSTNCKSQFQQTNNYQFLYLTSSTYFHQQRLSADGILIPNLHKALPVICHFSMKTLKLPQNSILIIYLILLLLGLTFVLSGYSFSFRPLNILLIIIIVFYPIFKFIRSGIKKSLKIFLGLFLIISVILIGWNVPVLLAFGNESTLRSIQEWNLGNYRISLTEKQGWSGGPYLQYDLIRYRFFRIVKRTIAVGHPENRIVATGHLKDQPEDLFCKVRLEGEYSRDDMFLFEFDTCKLKLEKMPSNGR